jgi:serine protease Do
MNTNFYNNKNSNQNGSEKKEHIIPEADYRIEDAEPETKNSRKKPKNDFFRTLRRGAAYAAVFGLVAGSSFAGFQYISSTFSNKTEKHSEQAEEKQQLSLTDNSASDNNAIQTGSTTTSTDVSEIAESVMPSIVAIDCDIKQTSTNFFGQTVEEEGTGSGTGIIIKQDDEYLYIATNNHVVADSESISVTFNDEKTAAATIKGTDASCDLAVIAVKLSDISSDTKSAIKTAVLGDSTTLKVGEMSVAIGNALGYGQSVTVGYISATSREVEMDNGTMTLLQTDAAINPGNSGGALVNSKGEVIGINSAKYASDEIEGMGFAIPISDAIPILEDLLNREEIAEADQGYLGITGRAVEDTYQSMYNMPEGFYINSVEEDSPAAQAGLKEGYIITKVKGRSVASETDIQDILSYTKGGTTVEVTYQTQTDGTYTEHTVNVTLGKKSDSPSYTPSEDTDETTSAASDAKDSSGSQNDSDGQTQNGSSSYGYGQLPYGYGNNGNSYGYSYGYGNSGSGSSDYQSGFPYGYMN